MTLALTVRCGSWHAESVVRTCGDGGVTVAHIPLDRGDIGGGDLVGGGADDIQTGCQNEVLRFPVGGVTAVVGGYTSESWRGSSRCTPSASVRHCSR